MFSPDKAAVFRSFISQTSSTGRIATGIVVSAAMLVAIGAAQPPREALSAVDRKDIEKMSASHVSGSPSRLLFLETDPAWYAKPAAKETSAYLPPDSADMETGMAGGHIQAF